MPTIRNTTHSPIAVPLPRGKVLHLSPGKSGEIAAKATDHPPLAELLTSGAIKVEDTGRKTAGSASGGGSAYGPRTGHHSGQGPHRGGDR